MKPTGSSDPSTPKSSLSKSLKKSKSRSKGSKSNSQPTTSQQQQCQDYVTTPTSSEYFKEKGSHKSYAGFGPRTIKVFWQQHDTCDTDVMPEVYSQLAEDVTYKVWEIINTVKTYARHSGGRVTHDIVNEVLKDSDVPPILGAFDHTWEKIEYDGSYYFHNDEDLDLREEYLKEVKVEVPNVGDITASWSLDRKHSKVLFEFSSTLCAAIFLGDEEAFKYGLDIAAFAPQIGCILKIILKKCIEILAFEQKPKTTCRCMKFLSALAFNIHSRDVECQEQLFHLAELFICLILGSRYPDIKEESFELVKNFLENSDTEIKKGNEVFNQIDVDDIRNTYEALFQMMARDGFQERDNMDTSNVDVKTEPHEDNIELMTNTLNVESMDIPKLLETVQVRDTMDTSNVGGIKVEDNIVLTTNKFNAESIDIPNLLETVQMSESMDTRNVDDIKAEGQETIANEESVDSPKLQDAIQVEFSPYKTEMIAENYLEPVFSALGNLSSQFGYFQNECTFLIERRLEKFFSNRVSFNENDYKLISRMSQALITLGDHAFRELTPYLEQIDPFLAPEWISNCFSSAAIFLNGRDDIFLYEWLQALCGSQLQPFMLYFYKYLEHISIKRFKAMRKATYTIHSKIILKVIDIRLCVAYDLQTMFPERQQMKPKPKQIGLRFAECCPVIPKSKDIKTETSVLQKPLDMFNSRVVIGRRKMLKPLTDQKRFVKLSNYCFLQL